MKTARWTEKDMSAAIKMIGEGATQKEACDATGVSLSLLSQKLDELECHHPDCSELNPCRSAKRRKGGVMTCLILEDTEFDGVCPFYKTADDFDEEERQARRRHAKTNQRGEILPAPSAEAHPGRAEAEQVGG